MIPDEMKDRLRKQIEKAEDPREQVVDVMYEIQDHYGYLDDKAVLETAELLNMTPLEVDELATFYDFIYRESVGKYVIHVCDGVVCWMFGQESVLNYLSGKLGISAGETTADGLFTLLPVCCVGYCDQAPAMLINGEPYVNLTSASIDRILDTLRSRQPALKGPRSS